jgi:hypothetical protein
MGTIRPSHPVKLFAGVLLGAGGLPGKIEDRLVTEFGRVDHRSKRIPFENTNYYSGEMGHVIDRVFFSFENLIEADELAAIKTKTNRIEDEHRNPSARVYRPVNADPGYLEEAKIVLASTKNFPHRIYLGQGIFGEVELHFENNTYQFLPWTYPDYKSREYQDFFLHVRQIYRAQLGK